MDHLRLKSIGGLALAALMAAAPLPADPLEQVTSHCRPTVHVLGQVHSPGDYELFERDTLRRVLTAAGGATSAAGAEIVLLRTFAIDEVPEHAPRLQIFRVEGLQSDEKADEKTNRRRDVPSGQNLLLRGGDVIHVTQRDTVLVAGLVKSPGSYVVERRMTVAQAIALAGGATEAGDEVVVRLLRTVQDRKRRKTELLPELEERVQVGDIVVITNRATEGLPPWTR